MGWRLTVFSALRNGSMHIARSPRGRSDIDSANSKRQPVFDKSVTPANSAASARILNLATRWVSVYGNEIDKGHTAQGVTPADANVKVKYATL